METHKRNRDSSKILDGEDGKWAGYGTEVGEREWRAEEGISTGRIVTVNVQVAVILCGGGYLHSTRLQPRLENGRGRTSPVAQSDASVCA